jgi:hypothetical protein
MHHLDAFALGAKAYLLSLFVYALIKSGSK